jgi:hypothetical protein
MKTRRILIVAAAAIAAVVAGAGPALADAPPNDHNCAGAIVSSVAGPGFGQGVSEAAHRQAVDNFGFADCGQDNRKNP